MNFKNRKSSVETLEMSLQHEKTVFGTKERVKGSAKEEHVRTMV